EPAGFQPTREQWCRLVDLASSYFASDKQDSGSGQLDKVVLSREARFRLKGQLSPWALMDALQKANPCSYNFLFTSRSEKREVFLGCSPERLIKRQDRIVKTEALAGTSRRGKDRHEDFQLEVLLMNDRKNIHENRLVLDDIRQQLTPLCESLETDRCHSVLKLKTIQHLRYLVHGVLQEGIYDEQLIAALHPTPAVGGTPRKRARAFIEANEPYSRGLYAGACGVLGTQRSEFSVAIRSARLTPDRLSLFSGAGIVRGSVARDEWQELDNKIATAGDTLFRLQFGDRTPKDSSDAVCRVHR
ncbi:MAG: isochorismate synthase, partial [Endozoicomonas sp.]